jgi:hypothetical protein
MGDRNGRKKLKKVSFPLNPLLIKPMASGFSFPRRPPREPGSFLQPTASAKSKRYLLKERRTFWALVESKEDLEIPMS